MIDDRIGSIGSTHGVNDSATPITKNAATTIQKRPLLSTLSTPLPSNHEPTPPPGDRVAAPVVAPAPVTPCAPASASTSCTRALPSPPKAARLTLAGLVIGG